MNTLYDKPKRSSTFGIIAIVISVIAFETPRFMLPMVFIALAAFAVIGLVRDGNKLYSALAVGIGLFLVYLMADQEATKYQQESSTYNVRYEVTCGQCDVSYTNYSGGTDSERDVRGKWSKSIAIKGDEFVYLNAQNDQGSPNSHVSIWVNGEIIDGESASGDFSTASVSGRPVDIYKK